MIAALLILLLSCSAFAETGNTIIESLAQTAWLPQQVRAEWQSTDPAMQKIAAHQDWQWAEPKPTRLAGATILNLQRTNAENKPEKIAVSGTLRIFGQALLPKHEIPAGQKVTREDLWMKECDWTYLADLILESEKLPLNAQAAHALLPDRPLTVRDLKPSPLVHRGQRVALCYADGNINVRLNGRALKDGAPGDRIPVTVDMGTSRQYEGMVAADGSVLWVR